MANQPKRLPYERRVGETAASNDLLPEGVVARDDAPAPPPPPVTLALLKRGQQRFDIYCAPCHSRVGDGQGMIVQRGFPAPPPYTSDRLMEAPSQHFYDVITNGYGVMFSYADRVTPEDRWAITAYIRALQTSQHASLDQAPPDVRNRLER
jgi:mono/diheme cytochrome c family protein